MSVIQHVLVRGVLPNQSLYTKGVLGGMQLRFARKPNEKMTKPEDKSSIILGKRRPTKVKQISGVSDKQYPILVKWKKPERTETCNPVISGDIGGIEYFGEVDKTKPPIHLEKSKVLSESEQVVQEILSLNFCRKRQITEKVKQTVVKSVQSHNHDNQSLEVKIALLTVKIRNYQQTLIELFPYKNQPLKHDLTYKIALRRNLLELLREKDYRKYEWLLEKLNLFYKPVPHYDVNEIGRKASIERLTDIWCDELRQHRLDKHKRKLQEQQPAFLRDKAEKLKFIMAEERELGLEQTVVQADIDECLERAVKIEQSSVTTVPIPEVYLLQDEIIPEKNFIN